MVFPGIYFLWLEIPVIWPVCTVFRPKNILSLPSFDEKIQVFGKIIENICMHDFNQEIVRDSRCITSEFELKNNRK